MATKKNVIKKDETLPEGLTVDDIMKELYFKTPEDNGLNQMEDPKKLFRETFKRE